MTDRKAMVTGGAGFIGSHIVERLIAEGIATVSIDNYVTGKRENLAHCASSPLLTAAECDVTDREKLATYMADVDVVFHNAASKKTICLRDPRLDLRINAEGTFNVLECARQAGVRKVVLASTGSVYGEAKYYPQDEQHPLNPTSYYGVSKLAGERYGEVFYHLYGLDVTILRYFHVYGPRQDYSDVGGVVPIFARNVVKGEPITIHGDGTQQRSFTYVDDVVDINMLAATDPRMRGACYNCASGIKVTIGELAESVKANLQSKQTPVVYDDWTPGDIKVFDVDNAKLRALGFTFKTPFVEGLAATCAWLQHALNDVSPVQTSMSLDK